METPARFNELRAAYESAFEQFCHEVRILNTRQAQFAKEGPGVQQQRVREAEERYRRSRDNLANLLIQQQHTSAHREHEMRLPA